ncbi:VasL domain-containing protein [Utexia brackfieldae]|uniref:VasL domain-containing protein n=1 Tax=Utexia brackfieldae TaxID=3074108 RepID=UPI00370DB030
MSVHRQIGGDPRAYLAFSEIRNEINKMNHPAAPAIDYRLIEAHTLTLFKEQGLDLQTTAYFTLAKTKLVGLIGMCEGLELIALLIRDHWSTFWPTSDSARINMLDWLNRYIDQDVRSYPFTTKQIPLLLQMERSLKTISQKLQQVSVKKPPQIYALYDYIKNTRISLEQRSLTQKVAKIQPKSKVIAKTPQIDAAAAPHPIIMPVIPAAKPTIRRLKGWHGFILGIAVSGFCLLAFYSLQSQPNKPAQLDLSFFQPQAATRFATEHRAYLPILSGQTAAQADYARQLQQVMQLSPLATRYYGANLVALAARLWPNSLTQQALTKAWHAQLTRQYQDRFSYDSYHQVQQRLSQLLTRLDRAQQDPSLLTFSQFQSALYEIQQQLDKEAPVEALLRQLSVQPTPSLIKQIDQRLNSLLSYYYVLSSETAG